MKIRLNKRILRSGEILEVEWDSTGWTGSQALIVHTGGKETSLQVPLSGSKKLRMKGGSLVNWIGLRSWEYGRVRTVKRYFLTIGKRRDTDEFEYVGQQPLRDNMDKFSNGFQRWWRRHTPEKQRLYIIALLLLLYQIILPHNFGFSNLLLTGTIFYIFWLVVRK